MPSFCAKLSWKLPLSPSGCSACAANRQYTTGLSIHYRDMTCFDGRGLYLKKFRSACSILEQSINISFGPNEAPLGAWWWPTLRALTTERHSPLPHAARECARHSSRSLNILTVREPMGLSTPSQLLVLASYRMTLTRESKSPSRIARKIKLFLKFCLVCPQWLPIKA